MGRNISAILKEKRKGLGLSVKTVLDELRSYDIEISDKTLYGWESGHRQPDADTFLILCQIYGIDTLKDIKNATPISDEAMRLAKDYDELDNHGRRILRLVADEELIRCKEKTKIESAAELAGDMMDHVIPIRRSYQPASAGTGMYLGPDEFETIYVKENDLTRRASFGVPVSGDSMEPNCHDGDVLLVERAEDIKIGEVGVFTINGEGYVKERGHGNLFL